MTEDFVTCQELLNRNLFTWFNLVQGLVFWSLFSFCVRNFLTGICLRDFAMFKDLFIGACSGIGYIDFVTLYFVNLALSFG